MRLDSPQSCGALAPCQVCKMSQRNTVHNNKRQYGYHVYVPPKEGYDAQAATK